MRNSSTTQSPRMSLGRQLEVSPDEEAEKGPLKKKSLVPSCSH